MKKYNITDEMVPNKTVNEYLKDVIEPKLKSEIPGINIANKELLLSSNIKIRNLSKIGYGLLNFIIYNYLFFSNLFGFIDDEDLQFFFLFENKSCIQIINDYWKYIKNILNESFISIEIFMNQIFPKLMELINKCEFFNKMEERNKFEDNVEMIIKECINNYKSYKNRYISENYKIENINKEEFKVIANELVPPEEYDEKEYPMLEYFMLTKYPNKQSFTNILKRMDEIVYKNKYPLISQLLFSNYNTEKLKYL
jgi:hypothetical protein